MKPEQTPQSLNYLLHIMDCMNDLKDIDIDKSFAELQQRLAGKGAVGRLRQKKIRRFLAAASSLAAVLIAGMICLFPLPAERESSENIRLAGTATPPDRNVTLTLPDGNVIVLGEGAKEEALEYEAGGADAFYNLKTPHGKTYRLTLSDGTRVCLNAGSGIKYPAWFTGDTRRVEITGEVWLDVAPAVSSTGVKKSFVVVIPGKGEINVLGTHFNVQAYPGDNPMLTTLIEGEINFLSYASGSSVTIQAGHGIAMNAEGELSVSATDSAQAVAWMDGKFVFRDADIAAVMQQIARWYDVDVVYNGTVTHHFVGTIQRSLSLPDVLEILEGTGEVRFHVEGNTVTVTP